MKLNKLIENFSVTKGAQKITLSDLSLTSSNGSVVISPVRTQKAQNKSKKGKEGNNKGTPKGKGRGKRSKK